MNVTTLAQYYNNHPMMNGRDYSWGAGMMLFCFVIFVLFIMGIVYVLRGHSHPHHMDANHESPIDIAKKRYATGEITKAEFEQIKKDLA
jgi:putative membrane protein